MVISHAHESIKEIREEEKHKIFLEQTQDEENLFRVISRQMKMCVGRYRQKTVENAGGKLFDGKYISDE